MRQPRGFGTSTLGLPLELGARVVRLRDPEFRSMRIVTGSLQHMRRFLPLRLFLCALGELLGFAGRLLRLVARLGGDGLVGRALRKRRRQREEKGSGRLRMRAQLVDLRLQRLHAGERPRDVGVAALELFGERQQQFQLRFPGSDRSLTGGSLERD